MDEMTMFKMKKSGAFNAAERFDMLIKELRKYQDPDTARKIMRSFFVDDDIHESHLRNLAEFERREIVPENGKNRLMLYYLTEEGQKVFNDYLTFDFIADANRQYAKKFSYGLDPLSTLLEMGSDKRLGAPKNYDDFFIGEKIFLKNFDKYEEGVFGNISGRPGSGKTSWACKMMELSLDDGFDCITNIKIKNKPKDIHYITKISEFFLEALKYDRWIAFIDETAIFVPKKRAMKQQNIDFENFGRIVRKLKGNMIMITHNFYQDIPTLIQTWTTELFYKKDKKIMEVTLTKNPDRYMSKVFRNVPNTSLRFNTEDISLISFDVNLKDLYDEIADAKGQKQRDLIKEYIEKQKGRKEEKEKSYSDEEIKEMVDEKRRKEGLKAKNQGIKAIAKELGMKKSTVERKYYRAS